MARPKGATNIASRAVKDLIDECVDMKEVISKLIELSNGIKLYDPKTQKEYTDKPDTQAAKILMEYRYGKPHQSVDVTSKGEAIAKSVLKLPDGTIIEI